MLVHVLCITLSVAEWGLWIRLSFFLISPIQREPSLLIRIEPCPLSILVLVYVIFRLISRVDPPYFFKVIVYLRFYPKWFLGVILISNIYLSCHVNIEDLVIFSSLEAVNRIRVTQE